MSYYHPSFSQTVAMTRGRGFSSYRGSSSRSSWGGRSDRGGRGYGSPRRGGNGRFSSSFSNSFDSRSKYSSDRYSSSKGHYDDYHNKSYRSDGPGGYGGRDSHRSPERKRLRPEAPSRRSHDGYGDSFGRYESSSSLSDRRSFSRDRRPPPFSHRDDFRKPLGPPPSSSRGGFRGRISSRGSRGGRLGEPPRRRLMESSYAVRRRVSLLSSEFVRRRKVSRLRSIAILKSASKKPKGSDKEEEEDESEKEENEEVKEGEEKAEKKEKSTEDKEEEAEDGKGKKETPKKSSKKGETEQDDDKKSETDEEEKRKSGFIKLVCPHCSVRCITFSKFNAHLYGSRHLGTMRRVAMKQKAVLSRMRLNQRFAQREVEKTTEDLSPHTNFCPLCKLNYKQPKATHQASDCHKSMKKFLMPYCKCCRITFKSPMLYETHICTIDHMKRKARVDGDKSEKEDSNEEDNLENFMTIDSVGDVNDADEEKKKDGESKVKEQINVGLEQIRKVEVHYCDLCRMYLPRVKEAELEKTLTKHCKQRTHLQCYIRYKEDKEIARCAERLQRKETAEKEKGKAKDKEDEEGKMPTKENAEDKEKIVKNGPEKEKTGNSGADDEEAGEDKLWADVDKDLGDILAAEAESGNKSSDEDDADGERYDRFGYSEKNGEDKKLQEDGTPDENNLPSVKIEPAEVNDEVK